jgi:hypothetical protein
MTNNARAAAIACSLQPRRPRGSAGALAGAARSRAVETARTERGLRLTLRADQGVADEPDARPRLLRLRSLVRLRGQHPGCPRRKRDSRGTIAAAHGMFTGFERRLRQARTYLITFGNVPGTSASPEARDQGTAGNRRSVRGSRLGPARVRGKGRSHAF